MILAIVGSRTFSDYELMKSELKRFKDISMIVSGGAIGADSLAERYSKENNIPIKIIKPNWKLGKHAGFLRNDTIAHESDEIIAFWDGISKGTQNTINTGIRQGKKVAIIEVR